LIQIRGAKIFQREKERDKKGEKEKEKGKKRVYVRDKQRKKDRLFATTKCNKRKAVEAHNPRHKTTFTTSTDIFIENDIQRTSKLFDIKNTSYFPFVERQLVPRHSVFFCVFFVVGKDFGMAFRVGRTVPGKGKYHYIFLFLFPIIFYYLEYDFLSFSLSVKETKMKLVEVESPFDVRYSDKAVVHFAGPVTQTSGTTDSDFSIHIQDSLVLHRHTEYCQWREHEARHCDRCGRDNHECNCRTTYFYTKEWTSHRINSLIFEQPAAHYNPQRDPFPSKSFAASTVKVNDFT